MALQSHQPQLCTAVVQKNHPSCGGPERLFVSTVLCPPSPGHNHSICLLQMLVSAAHVCPWKSQRSSSAASWNPMVMRWWQTQVVSPIVSLIQTFRLQFKGSCIPASYSLKLAYLVSKLWSHPLWGMLCAVLREQTWMSLLLVFEGFFPPCPTVALFDSQSALPTPRHARWWFPYPHAANTLFPPGCGQASLQAVSFSHWQVFQQKLRHMTCGDMNLCSFLYHSYHSHWKFCCSLMGPNECHHLSLYCSPQLFIEVRWESVCSSGKWT